MSCSASECTTWDFTLSLAGSVAAWRDRLLSCSLWAGGIPSLSLAEGRGAASTTNVGSSCGSRNYRYISACFHSPACRYYAALINFDQSNWLQKHIMWFIIWIRPSILTWQTPTTVYFCMYFITYNAQERSLTIWTCCCGCLSFLCQKTLMKRLLKMGSTLRWAPNASLLLENVTRAASGSPP